MGFESTLILSIAEWTSKPYGWIHTSTHACETCFYLISNT